MKSEFVILVIVGLVLVGCVQNPPPPNVTGNNTTIIPPGYEVKDYCQKDSDCVRLHKCCDCGMGEYVNIYNQQNPDCPGPRCLCAEMASKGVCKSNRCIAVPLYPPQEAFCGWSTNGSCSSDEDCIAGGCSGQVCQSQGEEPVITTCEYRDCYNGANYGVSCGCADGKCRWK